jgi:SAM-dependent methyltransferase
MHLEDLFYDLQGYELSRVGRLKLGRTDDYTLTYGEVTPEAMEMIVEKTAPAPGAVFYDLGCGVGKAVLFAAALRPFARCTGIEIVPDLYVAAQQARERFEESARTDYPDAAKEITFVQGDIFTQDLSDADVVFSHCTCFDEDLMARLATVLGGLRSGAQAVTVTKELPAGSGFTLRESVPFRLGWGEATVFFYRKD